MKVSNKQLIRKLTFILIITSTATGSLSLISLLRPSLFSNPIILLLFILFLCSSLLYTRLRYIEFDSTGEVLVFKRYHPVKNGKHPHKIEAVELPKHMVKKHLISKGLFYKKLILMIENETNQKLIKITLNLTQTDAGTMDKIRLELEKLLKK